MTIFALVSSIALGMGSLAWGYAQAGMVSIARWLLIFGVVWLFSQWRGWGWFSSLGLFAAVLAAAVGFWFEFNAGWMFAGAVFALFAWDMTDFRNRLRFVAVDDDLRGMERRHIARVGLLSLAGLALASIALLARMQFTFEWAVFLVIAILLGLAQVGAWFRKQ